MSDIQLGQLARRGLQGVGEESPRTYSGAGGLGGDNRQASGYKRPTVDVNTSDTVCLAMRADFRTTSGQLPYDPVRFPRK